jgi:FG-GAP repeat
VNLKTAARVLALFAVFSAAAVSAAELHPIIEIDTGYFFGGSENGKWIKAEQAAKSVRNKTTYQVYSLTKQVGQITAGQPKSVEEPCPDTLMVSLSSKPKDGVIGLAATWNALPRKPRMADTTQQVYIDVVRDFLKTNGIEQPQVKIDNIIRVDLDGDGEEEVLISATNYFSKDNRVPMRSPAGSYSMVLLRRQVAGKVETQLVEGEFYPKAYPTPTEDDASFNAPNAYKVISVLDLDGDGKMEIVVGSNYYEGEMMTIYQCDPNKAEAVLSVGCGA